MSELSIDAIVRKDVGKGASRRLRREQNQIPAIVYGAGKDPVSLTLDHNAVLKALKNDAFYSSVLALKIDGKSEAVVLKDIQRHPYKPKVTHMDFLRIKAGEKITMSVPLHFLNEDTAVGVKQDGGVISHLMTEVEIRCLPKDLPEFLDVDMGPVTLDQTLHLSDIKLPSGVEITALSHDSDEDPAVANIHTAKAAAEPAVGAGEETTAENKKDDADKSE